MSSCFNKELHTIGFVTTSCPLHHHQPHRFDCSSKFALILSEKKYPINLFLAEPFSLKPIVNPQLTFQLRCHFFSVIIYNNILYGNDMGIWGIRLVY